MNKKRLKELRRKMKCPVVVFGSNVRYLTEIGNLNGPLLVTRDTEFLISSDMELAETAGAANVIKPKKRSATELFKILNDQKIKRIGLDLNSLPYDSYKKLNAKVALVDAGNILKEMREVKDAKEIKKIKESCAMADRAMRIAARSIKKGTTERKIRTNALAVLDGCEDVAFNFVVASGPNSLYTHCYPTARRIKEKDFVIVDIGFTVDGYCSDITRTFCLRPTKKQEQLYSTVLKAQQIASGNVKLNGKCRTTCEIVEKFFKKQKVREYWKYSLGHGIGLDIHESPSLSLDSKDRFRNGMVFTIEPGLHPPEFGGVRIEDDFLITAKGPKLLTKFPRKLIP